MKYYYYQNYPPFVTCRHSERAREPIVFVHSTTDSRRLWSIPEGSQQGVCSRCQLTHWKQFPACCTVRGNPKKTAWFAEWKSQIPKPREAKAARISRTDEQRKRSSQRESCEDTQSPRSLWASTELCLHEVKLRERGKTTTTRSRPKEFLELMLPGKGSHWPRPEGKTCNTLSIRWSSQVNHTFVVGQISSRVKAAPNPS